MGSRWEKEQILAEWCGWNTKNLPLRLMWWVNITMCTKMDDVFISLTTQLMPNTLLRGFKIWYSALINGYVLLGTLICAFPQQWLGTIEFLEDIFKLGLIVFPNPHYNIRRYDSKKVSAGQHKDWNQETKWGKIELPSKKVQNNKCSACQMLKSAAKQIHSRYGGIWWPSAIRDLLVCTWASADTILLSGHQLQREWRSWADEHGRGHLWPERRVCQLCPQTRSSVDPGSWKSSVMNTTDSKVNRQHPTDSTTWLVSHFDIPHISPPSRHCSPISPGPEDAQTAASCDSQTGRSQFSWNQFKG